MTVDLAALADPEAEAAYRAQLAREAYRDGYDEGFSAGAAAQAAAYKAVLTGVFRSAQLEQRRRHVCCAPCRRTGHRNGCTRCEDRSRETYGNSHPDDYPGRQVSAA